MGIELTLDDLPPHSEHARLLANSLTAAQKASQIRNLMLTYLGQPQGKPTGIDLTATIHHGLTLLQPSLPASIRLESQPAAPGLTIAGNLELVGQILPCLLTNAAEACGETGGVIRVSLGTATAREIPPRNRFPVEFEPETKTYACLSIADDGCGIPEEDLGKLFDPFFTPKFHGHSLGLAVILGVARSHDRVVVVDSSVGKGSCFRLDLPLASPGS